jgi:hypothetical protein
MKYILLFIFGILGFSASAQWYRIDLKLKKKLTTAIVRDPLLTDENSRFAVVFPVAFLNTTPEIQDFQLRRSQYSIETAQRLMIKTAQHNMRYGIFTDASCNFSDLAHLFLLQNRFSEAKWYILQSLAISRRQKNYLLTVANLVDLGLIKARLGDYKQAEEDLYEAQSIALTMGLADNLADIEKKMLYVKQNSLSPPKVVYRYADAESIATKGQ